MKSNNITSLSIDGSNCIKKPRDSEPTALAGLPTLTTLYLGYEVLAGGDSYPLINFGWNRLGLSSLKSLDIDMRIVSSD